MKPAPKDVEQPLSVPCQRLEFSFSGELSLSDELGRSEVARLQAGRVGLRAGVSADAESALASTQPPSKQPSRSPNLPQPVWAGAAKVCQKTDNSGMFLPTPNQPASKKVIENKDTSRLTPLASPPKPPKLAIYLPKSAILCHVVKKIYTIIAQPLLFQRLSKAIIEPPGQRMAYNTAIGKAAAASP